MSEKQKFIRRIKRGEKLVGNEAVAAAQLGLGDLFRTCNGEFALSVKQSFGLHTPAVVRSCYRKL